jgi:pseudouridine-5'-phosphate glycosidase
MVRAVEATGGLAAITGVLAGVPTVGLDGSELERFLTGVVPIAKLSARDVAWAMACGIDGATTVAASLLLAVRAGIPVLATGGIGGVHRSPAFDESADLIELARSPVVVVCAGAKSVLDLTATFERLETYGIPVVGYRTLDLPGFFTVDSGIRLTARVDSPAEVARLFRAQRALDYPGALLVVQPPPAELALSRAEVDGAVRRAEERARVDGITGGALTPYLLEAIRKETGDRAVDLNVAVLERNAALAAAVAAAIAIRDRVPESARGASNTRGAPR